MVKKSEGSTGYLYEWNAPSRLAMKYTMWNTLMKPTCVAQESMGLRHASRWSFSLKLFVVFHLIAASVYTSDTVIMTVFTSTFS